MKTGDLFPYWKGEFKDGVTYIGAERKFNQGAITVRAAVCVMPEEGSRADEPCRFFVEILDGKSTSEDVAVAKERVMANARAYKDSLKAVV